MRKVFKYLCPKVERKWIYGETGSRLTKANRAKI